MRKITALILCAFLTVALSAAVGAENALDPPRVFIEPDEDCVCVYIDGITDEYISAYSEMYVEDMSRVEMYAIDIGFGSIWTGSHYYFLSFIHPDDIKSPYRIDAQHSLPYKDGEDIVYEETKYKLTYYEINDGILTSGYLFKVYDKNAAENMTQKSYADTAVIAAYADEDGKDCIAGSWVSYFGGPDGGNDERMNITFLEKTGADTSFAPEKASPATGVTDIAAVMGVAVISAAAALAAKKKR